MAGKSQVAKNSTDLFMALAVVIVIIMILVPLPSVLLDVLMACNVLLSVLVLLLVIYTPRAIDFSSFPSVLLISTVFGLGLNVSSTRLILSKGIKFDGKMVKAFSSFVVGAGGTDGLVIGFIIFIIIIAVQTFVITKGSTRVAEVAARFTLDAMPMKQAAVESEYNAGAITEEESRKRKLEVQKEADFFGNMDGATKFVSGNVKVGIFITVINLIGGLILGMVLRGEAFTQAIGTYAALTIGDGLLSQLPSLIVSFATGLIVTRSASDGDSTLGSEIKKQFSQSAWIYYVGGTVIALLGVLPGFPWYVLIPMGGALIYLGWRLDRFKKVEKGDEEAKSKQKASTSGPASNSADVNNIAPLDPLSLEVGFALIPLVDREKGAELLERVTLTRREAVLDLGLTVPPIRITDSMRLDPNEYCFKIKGVEIGRSKIRMGSFMCMNTGGITKEISGEPTKDPAFGLPAIWVTEDKRDEAERAGYAVIDPPTIIATHLTELIKNHASEILGRQEVQKLLEIYKKDYPAVVEEVNKQFTTGEIQKVLQGLLKERVSIRNMVVIMETMADIASISKQTDVLVQKVRQALGRQICLQYIDDSHTLHVMTVNSAFESILIESRVDTVNGPIAALEPAEQRAWIMSLSSSINAMQDKGYLPIILCSEAARILVKASTKHEMPNLVVLSVTELVDDIKVEIVGEVKVGN